MKIPSGQPDRGIITVIFIILLAIMMILITVEASALIRLRREAKLLQQQQIERLNAVPAETAAHTISHDK